MTETRILVDLMSSGTQWSFTPGQLGVSEDMNAQAIVDLFMLDGVAETVRDLGLLEGVTLVVQVKRTGQLTDTAETPAVVPHG